MPTNTLVEHQNWHEISTLIRLVYVVGCQCSDVAQIWENIPELIHLVSLVAAEGPTLVRKSVYGIIINLLQTLYLCRNEDNRTEAKPEILQLINDCTLPENLQLFGLRRETSLAEYSSVDLTDEKASLDSLEKLMQLLLRVMHVTAESIGMSSLQLNSQRCLNFFQLT